MTSLRAVVPAARILAITALVALLYFGRPVLLPIVLSVFLFYALDPIVDRLQRLRVPRVVGSVSVVVLLLGGTAAAAIALWPQVESVVSSIPEGARQLRQTIRAARSGANAASALRKMQEAAVAIDQAAAESQASTPSKGTLRVEIADPWRATDALWLGGMGAVGLAAQSISVLFLTIFLLIEDDSFKRKLLRQMETMGEKRVTLDILNAVAAQIERFIWVQIVTSAGVALLTALALWWLGVSQPAVWGMFAGVMNLVPFFGPLIVTVVIAAVAFLQFGTLGQAAAAAGAALAITVLEGNIITPKLLSRAASLNLVAIFIAITFWSALWGVAGMLLAVPILMAIKVVCDHVRGLESIGEFLGE